ncbi:HdeD family acid-resistance protein [Pedobacter sp.]|uniref:HdeD family acid-resistance protein n=1 Tax=Pedobacter sp. TaxID=1411316 RepID=UPI003D7FB818
MKTQDINFIGYNSKYWWLMALAGLLFIGLGIWILATPVVSYLSLSLLFAFLMLLAGIFETVFSIGNHKTLQGWGWVLVGGLIDLFLGAYLLYYPALSMVVLPLIVGFWIMFRGFMAIGSSLELRSSGVKDWGWLMATGILIVLLSFILIANPVFAAINIVIWTGLALIITGIFRIMYSFQLKKLK